MTLIIKQLERFKKFINANKIDDATLHLICNYCDFILFKPKSYIFHIENIADSFYIIIAGKVSIRKKDNTEVVLLQNGDYFGDWGLIDKKKRNASAYVVEDSKVMIMNQKAFLSTILRCMKRAELNRKEFIVRSIPQLGSMPTRVFSDVYKDIIRLMLSKNEIVYRIGDVATKVYLIYEGTVKVNDQNGNVIINLSQRDFAGLESVFNYYKKKNNEDPSQMMKYESTVITTEGFNVLFVFDISLFASKESRKFLFDLYSTKKKIATSFLEERKKRKDEYKVQYRENIMSNIVNDNKGIIERCIKEFDISNHVINTKHRLGKSLSTKKLLQSVSSFSLKGKKHKPRVININCNENETIVNSVLRHDTKTKSVTISTNLNSDRSYHKSTLSQTKSTQSSNPSKKKIVIDRFILKSIKSYRMKEYNSGNLNLPLISQMS